MQLTVHYPQRKNTAKEKCRAAVAYPGATWKAMMHELDDDDPDDLFAAAMAAAAEEAMAEQVRERVSSHGMWKCPCLQIAHMTIRIESGPGGLTREVEMLLPSNSPHES
jgi:hypothetical protein